MRNYKLILLFSVSFFLIGTSVSCKIKNQQRKIESGEVFYDVDGKPINAHGAGIMYHNGKYYMYGEIKSGKTWLVPNPYWECYRTDAGGVSCYSSDNLIDWKYEGVALSPNRTDSTHELHISKIIERPKVIYNEKTKKFVMWLHIDSQKYSLAHAGVAISDNPTGPYQYLGSFKPNNQMSKDQTIFKDDDGKAYQIYSSESNKVMHISLLTNDYLKPSGKEIRIFINKSREAPAMFKNNGRYYLITSACSGWDSNAAMLASADSIMGKWTEMYNPCKGTKSEITFDSQSTFVLPIKGNPNKFLFIADRWKKTDLPDSRMIWLPLVFRNDSVVIEWKKSWTINDLK
jgi:Glycosyl hydrolases family 43